jgi:hypothetical protein
MCNLRIRNVENERKLMHFEKTPKKGNYMDPMNNLTPRAEMILALARKEADRFHHNYVGTEHVLLGLIKLGQGTAVTVLQKYGIDLEILRAAVEKEVGAGQETKAQNSIPYTPRVKKVLALAGKEAMTFNHSYLGSEHILLGLLREGEGLAARVLKKFDLDIERTRQEILRELDSSPQSSIHPEKKLPSVIVGFTERLISNLSFHRTGIPESEAVIVEKTMIAGLNELTLFRPSDDRLPKLLEMLDQTLLVAVSQELVVALATAYLKLDPKAEERLRAMLVEVNPNGKPQRNIGAALQLLNDGKPVKIEVDFLAKWKK